MTGVWRPGDSVEPLRDLLRRGGVLAIPTESSYGLGADPRNRKGVETIYRIKGREPRKALPVVVADLGQLADLGIDPDLSILKPLSACWPGPLTAVLPIADATLPAAAGEPTLAVRIPGHEGLRSLLAELGHGLTATSANRSGEEPILDPAELAEFLAGVAGEEAVVVDGGVLPGGPPSTLVALAALAAIEEAGLVVLRTGSFPVDRLLEALRARTAQGEEV